MGNTMKLAIPSMGKGGMDAQRSGHFGQCDCFTIVDIEDGKITGSHVIDNPPHEEGGCLRPVGILHDAGCDTIVAAGMGGRPLMGFNDAGITVLFENQTPEVSAVAQLAATGDLPIMTMNESCHH